MGGCVTGSTRRAGEELATLASVPTDVHTINQTDLPTLKFSFLLEDVKIRRCEYVTFSLVRRKLASNSRSRMLISTVLPSEGWMPA